MFHLIILVACLCIIWHFADELFGLLCFVVSLCFFLCLGAVALGGLVYAINAMGGI